jgi:hypothetical protein
MATDAAYHPRHTGLDPGSMTTAQRYIPDQVRDDEEVERTSVSHLKTTRDRSSRSFPALFRYASVNSGFLSSSKFRSFA